MNLNELGAYKHKVASVFANDPDIIDVLLGPVDEDADVGRRPRFLRPYF